jgi:exopolysaccharide biosynthesis polyprenyl glycosylphosphotransferase
VSVVEHTPRAKAAALPVEQVFPGARAHTRAARGLGRRRGWLVRRALLAADIVGLCAAFLTAEALFGATPAATAVDEVSPAMEHLFFLLSLPLWVLVATMYGLYKNDEERTDHSTVDDLVPVFHLVSIGTWTFFATLTLTGLSHPQLPKIIAFSGLAILLVTLLRATARAYCRRQVEYLQNTLIVGAGDVGQLVAHKLLKHNEYGLNLVGFVDDEPRAPREEVQHVPIVGGFSEVARVVQLLDVERVVIAFSGESNERTLDLVRELKDFDVQVDIVPRLFDVVGPSVGIHTIEGIPMLGLPSLKLSRSSLLLKRLFDVLLAAAGIVILSPLLLATAVIVKLDSRGPVLFRQRRVGIRDCEFPILKFRTMVADADARKTELAHLNHHATDGDTRMFKVADDPRITRSGRLLRRWSIDELPQLVNVIKGEMSLVGPRPLILDEDRWVEDWQRARVTLKPGITGPWQVLGGSDIPFGEMVKLDYLYVTSWSVFNDLKLVLRTVPAIVRGRTAY